MTDTFQYFIELPFWELLAVLSALVYVVLAAKENIWCWPAALISTLIYTVIFYDVYLWMDSLLQVYYLIMAVYGWYCWQNYTQADAQVAHIQSWPLQRHLMIIAILSGLSIVVGWLMANFTPADFPYFDSATTVFSVFATYMVAKKVLENWFYWIVIDAVSIYLYLAKDLQPTAMLFVFYVMMAIYGYLQWAAKANKDNGLTQMSMS